MFHQLNVVFILSWSAIVLSVILQSCIVITGASRTTVPKLNLDCKACIHVPVNHCVLNFSFSVVPQTNVIVSSEHPKGTSQEDSPLENLLSKWVAQIHTICLVETEVRNVQILPNTAPHEQCWGHYWKTIINCTLPQFSVQTIEDCK